MCAFVIDGITVYANTEEEAEMLIGVNLKNAEDGLLKTQDDRTLNRCLELL